ncbi:MAG: hypothetical protein ACXABC_06130 [Candidatus Thorarchaeota archaeon]|jgi:hypothetical protein
MIFQPPDIITPILVVFVATFFGFGFLIVKKRMRAIGFLLVVITIITGVVQIGLYNELNALEQGEILGVGILSSNHSVNISSTDTYISPQLSNWYTVFNLTVIIETNASEVDFSLIENSQPEVQYFKGKYSTANIELILPSLHTSQGSIANWSFSFYNPSNDSVLLDYLVHAGMIEDAGIREITYTEHYYTIAGKMLISFLVAFGIVISLHTLRNKVDRSWLFPSWID